MDLNTQLYLPFLVVFAFFTLLILILWDSIEKWGLQRHILMLANIFFLLLSLLVFFIQRKSLHAANPHQFIRSIMTGMMLKMFLTVAAILIYYFSARHFSRLSVVAAMLMYLFYLSAEIKSLLKLNRKPNA